MNKPKLIPELKVLDFKSSLDFYVRLSEFNIVYDRPEEDFAMLEREGAQIMIEGHSNKSRTWTAGVLERPLGLGMSLQIEVSDVNSLYEKFKGANYSIFQEIEEKWYRMGEKETGNKQFLVQDPDGYLLRFFQDLGLR